MAEYSYLSDGTKCGVVDNTTNGYDYLGSLIYSRSGSVRTLESAAFGGGRFVNTNNTILPYYYITDHLGSTRVITDNSGNVVERNDYYPFGGKHANSSYAQLTTNKQKFNGKELQTTGNTGFLDYGWRFYDPAIARWHVPDPLAENTYSLTPYKYAQNNPIRIFDVAGLSDYFDANGNYYGTDNTDDDYVRIISQENWDKIQVTDEDGNVSVNVEQGMELSIGFSEATEMSEEATLSVYDHYNPTDLDLAAHHDEKGDGGMTFNAERKKGKTSERIDVKIEGNRKTKVADHANEIKNCFAHEEQHYNDYKELGIEGYAKVPLDRTEQRAVLKQMKHESYKGTRAGFQRAIEKYGNKFGMIFPITQ